MLAILMLLTGAQAETVAQVIAVDGQVYIEQDGRPRAAIQAMEVDSSATLITAEESQLYLLLHNNRVVMFSDELELPVSKISALKDSPVDTPVAAQLKALMDPSDQERMQSMVAETEKIGGWEARLTSAVVRMRDEAIAEEETAEDDAFAEERAYAVAPGTPPPPQPTIDSTLAGLTADAAGAKCVKKWAKKAKLPGETVEIMVKLVDGRITAVFTADGEPLSRCMEERLLGTTLDTSSLASPDNGSAELQLP